MISINTDNLVVYMDKGAQEDVAIAISKRVGAPLSDKKGDELTLVVGKQGVSLEGYGLSYMGDFEGMLHRVTEGRLAHEMLSKVTKTSDVRPRAIDATAGMGEDSFILAATGYEVTLFEQNPVIAELLKDALRRAKKHPILGEIVSRMNLINGNSIELMPKLVDEYDLIYLDPMFPERQKTGLIGKKLQLIQKLERPCFEEKQLVDAAMSLKPKKIIVKRPLKGENLAGIKPNYSVKGKAIRYDCIVS